MAQAKPSTEALAAEVAELRALLTTQQATITTLEQRLQREAVDEPESEAIAPQTQASSAVAAHTVAAPDEAAPHGTNPEHGTSRRGLLRGAAVGAAAAAVAAVAVGGAEQAHAAPAATGASLLLGYPNDADNTTTLTNTAGSVPNPTLLVTNTNTNVLASTAIEGDGTYVGVLGLARGNDLASGVQGSTDIGTGVYGRASSGTGVLGMSAAGLGGSFSGGRAPLNLDLGHDVGAPTTIFHGMGDIYLDHNATVWVCVGLGTPGTWTRLTGVASGATGGAITYLTHPIRLLDTRAGTTSTSANQIPQARLTPGAAYTVNVANITFDGVSVPAGAVGALGNLTVVQPSSPGFLAVVPSGSGFQGTSNVNYLANQIVPNFFTVNLAGGNLDVYVDPNSQPVDVLLDLFAVVL